MNEKTLLIALLLLVGNFLLAQNITGKVYDEQTKEPLIGATISVVGSSTGVVTDFDGTFQLTVNKGDKLLISYTGFENQEILIDDREEYLIYLSSGVVLSEVTVVGSRGKPRTQLETAV
ncbi:MAG: carboxypeptidase-like regulatory domain-containing protein, partial [Bacteroidota bacterium]